MDAEELMKKGSALGIDADMLRLLIVKDIVLARDIVYKRQIKRLRERAEKTACKRAVDLLLKIGQITVAEHIIEAAEQNRTLCNSVMH